MKYQDLVHTQRILSSAVQSIRCQSLAAEPHWFVLLTRYSLASAYTHRSLLLLNERHLSTVLASVLWATCEDQVHQGLQPILLLQQEKNKPYRCHERCFPLTWRIEEKQLARASITLFKVSLRAVILVVTNLQKQLIGALQSSWNSMRCKNTRIQALVHTIDLLRTEN